MRFWYWKQLHIYLYKDYIIYPVYFNLSYVWNFGVLSFIFLIIQFITGIFLAMHYIPAVDYAFLSTEHIMRDISFGWLLRYIHANGASFFLCVYLHIFRNLYYLTYIQPRAFVWLIGIFIFILMIITAFLGYVLPWGQMSFWAATVITSLFSVFPIYGVNIVTWLWGGFSVNNVTLTRFFSLHYLFPFVILILVIFHILFLHEKGSSNPKGLTLKYDKVWFTPYFIRKDLYISICVLLVFIIIVTFYPNWLGHTDNYIMANPIVTPAHIVPEWYFLPFYAILRSIPSKIGGIIMLLLVIICLVLLPYLSSSFWRNTFFQILFQINSWFIFIFYFLLGWLGGCPIEFPYIFIGQILTLIFVLNISLIPFLISQQLQGIYNILIIEDTLDFDLFKNFILEESQEWNALDFDLYFMLDINPYLFLTWFTILDIELDNDINSVILKDNICKYIIFSLYDEDEVELEYEDEDWKIY